MYAGIPLERRRIGWVESRVLYRRLMDDEGREVDRSKRRTAHIFDRTSVDVCVAEWKVQAPQLARVLQDARNYRHRVSCHRDHLLALGLIRRGHLRPLDFFLVVLEKLACLLH